MAHQADASRARRVLGLLGRATVVAVGLALAVVLVWLRPFPAGEETRTLLEAGRAGQLPDVELVETPTWAGLRPTGEPSGVGLVFQPGARVDHRAYLPLLAPLAQEGHLVVVVAQPYGIAFLAAGAGRDARERHPEVDRWVVAGHSLGGVVSSQDAADDPAVDGLLLWASYPADDISGSDLGVTSVSGSEDGLSTPADIDASRADLPDDATFVVVDGATHAYFGDYGEQPGDGEATVPRLQAQAEITAASLALLDALR